MCKIGQKLSTRTTPQNGYVRPTTVKVPMDQRLFEQFFSYVSQGRSRFNVTAEDLDQNSTCWLVRVSLPHRYEMCCLQGAADNSSLSEPTKASFRPLGMPPMINKSDFRFAVVWFCHHSFDFRPNWTPISPVNIIYYAHKELSLTCVVRDWTAHVPWKINLRAAYSWFDSPSARKWKYPPPTFSLLFSSFRCMLGKSWSDRVERDCS